MYEVESLLTIHYGAAAIFLKKLAIQHNDARRLVFLRIKWELENINKAYICFTRYVCTQQDSIRIFCEGGGKYGLNGPMALCVRGRACVTIIVTCQSSSGVPNQKSLIFLHMGPVRLLLRK